MWALIFLALQLISIGYIDSIAFADDYERSDYADYDEGYSNYPAPDNDFGYDYSLSDTTLPDLQLESASFNYNPPTAAYSLSPTDISLPATLPNLQLVSFNDNLNAAYSTSYAFYDIGNQVPCIETMRNLQLSYFNDDTNLGTIDSGNQITLPTAQIHNKISIDLPSTISVHNGTFTQPSADHIEALAFASLIQIEQPPLWGSSYFVPDNTIIHNQPILVTDARAEKIMCPYVYDGKIPETTQASFIPVGPAIEAEQLVKVGDRDDWARLIPSENFFDLAKQIPHEITTESLKILQDRLAEAIPRLMQIYNNIATSGGTEPLRSEIKMQLRERLSEVEDFVTGLKELSVGEIESGLLYISKRFGNFPYPK